MKAFAFKDRNDVRQVKKRNRSERELENLRSEGSIRPSARPLAVRTYWVVPKGEVPAATDFKTPGVGEAYLIYLDREEETPVLKRWQAFNEMDGTFEDAFVPIYNWEFYKRKEDTADEAEGLKPLLLAWEDTFGTLQFERQQELRGKAVGDIPVGGTGKMAIYINGQNTGGEIDVDLDWTHGGEQISDGKEMAARWYPEDCKYAAIQADCEDDDDGVAFYGVIT